MATSRNRPFGWNAAAARYVDAQGRFVSKASVRAAIDGALDNASAVMAQATEALRSRALTVAQWHTIMRREVKNVHLYSAAAAKGGWAQLTQQDYGYLGQRIRQELNYLDNFARQLRNPRFPRDGRVIARSRMYAQAGRYTYHQVDRQVQVGAGMTHEKNILSAGEACQSCIEQADLEWVPIGTLVPVGNRECLTNCRCDIAYKQMSDDEAMAASTPDPDESRERPKAGTAAAEVWDLADELSAKLGRKATRTEVVQEFARRGGKVGTATGRYGRWARTYDASRGVEVKPVLRRTPKAAKEPRAPRTKASAAPEAPAVGERPSFSSMVRVDASVAGDNAFLHEVREAMDGVPPGVLRKLQERGVSVRVGDTLPDIWPELRGVRPRGWPPGSTWAQADGIYRQGDRVVAATARRTDWHGRLVRSDRVGGVLRHEMGHALDDAMLGESATKAFRRAYDADVAAMGANRPSSLSYYLQAGKAGPSEAFAEGFATALGKTGASVMTGADSVEYFRRHFPRTVAYIKDLITTLQ